MGLLSVLGLTPPGASPTGGPASAAPPADEVALRHDEIAEAIAPIGDDKVRAGLDAELAALRAAHARAADGGDDAARAKRVAAELAAADKLKAKAAKLAAQDAARRERSDARADADAVLAAVGALLPEIADAAARKRVEGELKALRAARDKADRLADGKAATAGFTAVRQRAETLRASADRIKFASDLSADTLEPQLAAAQAAIDTLTVAAKPVLAKELATLKADVQRYAAAGDSTALQSIVAPRLKKLHDVASGLPKASADADADLASADAAIQALDPTAAASLRERLAALQAQKRAAWPAGGSLDEVAASVDAVTAGAKALIAEAAAVREKAAVDAQVAVVRGKLDALKPRLDKAAVGSGPAYIAERQANVQRLASTVESQLAGGKPQAAEQTLRSLGIALDDLDKFKRLQAEFKAKLDAARNGPIKAAMAVKLQPAALAAARARALGAREAEIVKMTANGVFGPATTAIQRWITEAKAWADARETWDALHSDDPDVGDMEDLVESSGGGDVLDSLVAQLPPDKTKPKVFIAAMRARWGTKVEQFEKFKGPDDDDPDKKTRLQTGKPDVEQGKDLQGLYSILGKVPAKDVSYVEKIDRFTVSKKAASYKEGVFTDTIALHCGRPNDGGNTNFNLPGVVVPRGDKVEPGCEPVVDDKHKDGDEAPYFDFTVLHEVGHAVDDHRNIMKGDRAAEAGWDSHGTGHIAKKIAAHLRFDADYIEDMLDDAGSKPPKKRPPVPAGRQAPEWKTAGDKAEAWVKAIRVDQELWDNASGAQAHAIDGRVYHEAYKGYWVSYKYAARARGITGYQFRSSMEWFAELYAAFHIGKLNPKHPAVPWLAKLKTESRAG